MDKIDLKLDMTHLYQASAKAVVQVDVPALNFLMIDGLCDPNTSPAYAQAVEALFAVSYATKYLVKQVPQALDYAVMPCEGLWLATDMTACPGGLRTKAPPPSTHP